MGKSNYQRKKRIFNKEYDRISNEIVNLKNMYDKDINQYTEVNRINRNLFLNIGKIDALFFVV